MSPIHGHIPALHACTYFSIFQDTFCTCKIVRLGRGLGTMMKEIREYKKEKSTFDSKCESWYSRWQRRLGMWVRYQSVVIVRPEWDL